MNHMALYRKLSVVVLLWFASFGCALGTDQAISCQNTNIPSARLSYSTGRGLIGGVTFSPVNFQVHLVNEFGQDITTGGYEIQINLSGPDSNPQVIPLTSNDNGDGSLSYGYVTQLPGEYQLNVTLNGQTIGSSASTPAPIYHPFFVNASMCPLNDNGLSSPVGKTCSSKVNCGQYFLFYDLHSVLNIILSTTLPNFFPHLIFTIFISSRILLTLYHVVIFETILVV